MHAKTAAWTLALALAASLPVTAQERRAPRLPDTVVIERDLEYGKAGERSLKLDLLRPRDAGKGPLPVLVFIHGGGWRAGNKTSGHARLAPLVATGRYAGVSVGYRLSGEAIWPAAIHDCKAAIRWVRASARERGFDPERIGVFGSSAGGHLSSLLGTSGGVKELEGENGSTGSSSRVSCVIALAGPSDFLNWGGEGKSSGIGPVSLLLGGAPADKRDLAAAASPVTHASADDPPFLLLHGTRDTTVPRQQAERLHEALKKAGAQSALAPIEGAGHGLRGAEVDRRIQEFFDRHLGRAAGEVEKALDEALREPGSK